MNTKCEMLALGAVMLAILACLVWYMAEHPAPGMSQNGSVGTTTSATLTDHGDYYTIDDTYPASTPLAITAGADADTAAVTEMKAWVEASAAQFKDENQLANLTPEDIQVQGLGPDKQYAQSMEYSVYASPHTISYLFSIYEDTLGAHPNGYYHTFTFDSSTGTELQLADLFVPGADYLDPLSTTTRASLYASLGDNAIADFVDPGTTPDAQNFQFFALDGSDLVIFFPPYAVGPYAIGPQTVRIPRIQLKDILKPEYR